MSTMFKEHERDPNRTMRTGEHVSNLFLGLLLGLLVMLFDRPGKEQIRPQQAPTSARSWRKTVLLWLGGTLLFLLVVVWLVGP